MLLELARAIVSVSKAQENILIAGKEIGGKLKDFQRYAEKHGVDEDMIKKECIEIEDDGAEDDHNIPYEPPTEEEIDGYASAQKEIEDIPAVEGKPESESKEYSIK